MHQPGSTKGGGLCQAFPDTCKTPTPGGPAPMPYMNVGQLAQATKTAKKVYFVSKSVVTLKSEIPMSKGDEPGTAGGGAKSGTIINKIVFKKGSSKVIVEKQPCVHLMSLTDHNGSGNANIPGTVKTPSQSKVLVAI